MAQGDGTGVIPVARAEPHQDVLVAERTAVRSPSAGIRRASVGLIARHRELAGLDQTLSGCRLGEPAAVVLRGEPGVGKSALIEAAVARAGDFHVVQLRASGTAEPNGLPNGWPSPLVELFELASPRAEPVGASRLAAVVDGLALYPTAPVLLAIDDAELLPPWFIGALVAAVRALKGRSFALILAVTDSPHMPELELPAVSVTHRLGGLEADQVVALWERMTGLVPSAEVSKSLLRSVAGNPQAIRDASIHLSPDALRGWEAISDPLPIGGELAAAFGAALADLPADTRRSLVVVAAGRAPMNVLEAALSELDLEMDCLQVAADRRIVLLRRNRIDFAHPLVRAAAYHLEGVEIRSGVHGALSRAFLDAGLVEPGAWHAARSAAVPVSELIALYGRAAAAAAENGSVTSAARYEELMAGIGDTPESIGHHLARASSRWLSAGELVRATACLDRAAALSIPDHLRGEVAYWRCRLSLAKGPDGVTADELVAGAELSLPRHPGRSAEMLAEAAVSLLLAGSATKAEKVAVRAVMISESVGGLAEAVAGAVLGGIRVLGHLPGGGETALKAAMTFITNHPDGVPISPLFAYATGLALLEEIGPEATATWADRIGQLSLSGDPSLSCISRLLYAIACDRLGDLDEAAEQAGLAAASARAFGQRYIAARASALLVDLHGTRGLYQETFAAAAELLSASLPGEGGMRAGAYRALGEIELQQGRVPSALGWLRAAEFETDGTAAKGGAPGSRHEGRSWVATLAEVLAHDQQLAAVRDLVEVVEQEVQKGSVEAAWGPCIQAVVADDLKEAEELFNGALFLARRHRALGARIEFLYSGRLSAAGLTDRAASRLRSAITTMQEIGAAGWALLFEMSLELLDAPERSRPDLVLLPGGASDMAAAGASRPGEGPLSHPAREPLIDPVPGWEITMLGSFAVSRSGETIAMPTSLAATTIKVVALRGRILAEELVEELWPDSPPGVGMRRLRNILWRIRIACGDILAREDKFILLSPAAVTDVSVFRRLASEALEPSMATDAAARVARAALELYAGELLPGDRYEDWAAPTRELLGRLQVQMIELRVNDAIDDDRIQEATYLLDLLVETDPYEERHYLVAAELQAKAGNRRRALATIGRAERTLSELGILPSDRLKALGASLS